jgi:hypothetical protein
MTTRQFFSSKGETWEWEETPEVIEAVKKLHETISNLESEHRKSGGDYGVGK